MRITRADLHRFESLFKEYRKDVVTRAVKIDGPFDVETPHGDLHCDDGYLCVDARGYPYLVGSESFSSIYEEITPGKKDDTKSSFF